MSPSETPAGGFTFIYMIAAGRAAIPVAETELSGSRSVPNRFGRLRAVLLINCNILHVSEHIRTNLTIFATE